MKFIFTLLMSVLCFQMALAEEIKTNKFGGQVSEGSPITLDQVIHDFEKYKDKTIVLEAKVEKVCESKGCWMVLTDGKNSVRTLFKDYGFFVPKSILDKKIKVQGVMEQKSISVATQKHYLKDAGANARDIKKITSSKMEFQFTADAVEIL